MQGKEGTKYKTLSKESGSVYHHTLESTKGSHYFYWLTYFKKTEHLEIPCNFKYIINRDLKEKILWKI